MSSIGLGTGLHTFVLYLGPKIAQFTLASYQCGNIPSMGPSRFSINPVFECFAGNLENNSSKSILLIKQFLFGI